MSDRIWFPPTNITPGVWRANPNWETNEEIDVFRSINSCYRAETVATVRRLDHVRDVECRGEIYANALAIAAVPDLIDACEQALSDLEWIASLHNFSNFTSSIIKLKNVLSKARGEKVEG